MTKDDETTSLDELLSSLSMDNQNEVDPLLDDGNSETIVDDRPTPIAVDPVLVDRIQQVRAPVPLEDRTDSQPGAQIAAVLDKALSEFDTLGEKITTKYDADNTQLQEVIDYLKDVVIKEEAPDGNHSIPGIYVESLVKALEVKGNLSLTLVKLIDSKSRLLSAVRGGTTINNTNQTSSQSSVELEQILSRPVTDDFAAK